VFLFVSFVSHSSYGINQENKNVLPFWKDKKANTKCNVNDQKKNPDIRIVAGGQTIKNKRNYFTQLSGLK